MKSPHSSFSPFLSSNLTLRKRLRGREGGETVINSRNGPKVFLSPWEGRDFKAAREGIFLLKKKDFVWGTFGKFLLPQNYRSFLLLPSLPFLLSSSRRQIVLNDRF